MTITSRRLYRELRALAVALLAGLTTYGILWAHPVVVLISTWLAVGMLIAMRYADRRWL